MIFTFYKNFFSKYKYLVLINSKGQIGLKESFIICKIIFLMSLIVIPVIILTIIFSIKYSSSNKKSIYNPSLDNSFKIEFLVWSMLIVMIMILANITWKSTHLLDPQKEIKSHNPPLIIEVIALDWKWLFIYPKEGIATVNEVVFPKNVPLKFKVTSNSVMNSFFIPQLGSQIYAMAGMNSSLNLISNFSGKYDGFSSNFSGSGFSEMKFLTKVTINQMKFKEWVNKIKYSSNNLYNFINFEELAKPSENFPIKYFSKIKNNLFFLIMKKCKNQE